jgi:hypothetical protein
MVLYPKLYDKGGDLLCPTYCHHRRRDWLCLNLKKRNFKNQISFWCTSFMGSIKFILW